AYLHRNLSGKYKIFPLSQEAASFDYLKRTNEDFHQDGVYFSVGEPRIVTLAKSNAEFLDFYVANGNFGPKSYELLSYVSGNTAEGDSAQFSTPIGILPPSETKARGELDVVGQCLTNIPPRISDYVQRRGVEVEIREALEAYDRRPIITLHGSGGVGKTSLALE